MKKVKKETTEGIRLPNQEIIRTLGEKEKLQVVGNIKSRHHQKQT